MWRIYKKITHTFERVSTNCHSRKVTDCSWMHIVQRVISFIAFIVLHSIVEFCSQFRFFYNMLSLVYGVRSRMEKKMIWERSRVSDYAVLSTSAPYNYIVDMFPFEWTKRRTSSLQWKTQTNLTVQPDLHLGDQWNWITGTNWHIS